MMEKFWNFMLDLSKKEEGAALAEYGLLVALIAVICITAVGLLGTNIMNALTTAAGSI
jgi:pilus assembly protein Flp/PilA